MQGTLEPRATPQPLGTENHPLPGAVLGLVLGTSRAQGNGREAGTLGYRETHAASQGQERTVPLPRQRPDVGLQKVASKGPPRESQNRIHEGFFWVVVVF